MTPHQNRRILQLGRAYDDDDNLNNNNFKTLSQIMNETLLNDAIRSRLTSPGRRRRRDQWPQ